MLPDANNCWHRANSSGYPRRKSINTHFLRVDDRYLRHRNQGCCDCLPSRLFFGYTGANLDPLLPYKPAWKGASRSPPCTLTHTLTHTGKRTDGNNGTNRPRPHPFRSEKRLKALQRNGLKLPKLLVRMRSAVRICPAAPKQPVFFGKRAVFLTFSAIMHDAILR